MNVQTVFCSEVDAMSRPCTGFGGTLAWRRQTSSSSKTVLARTARDLRAMCPWQGRLYGDAPLPRLHAGSAPCVLTERLRAAAHLGSSATSVGAQWLRHARASTQHHRPRLATQSAGRKQCLKSAMSLPFWMRLLSRALHAAGLLADPSDVWRAYPDALLNREPSDRGCRNPC